MTLSFLLVILTTGRAAAEAYWTPKDPPRAHYRIEARIDPDSRCISGTESITLRNTADRSLEFLGVDWQIRDEACLDLRSDNAPLVLVNPQKNPPVPSPLIYRLPKPLKPGSEITLTARFASWFLVRPGAAEIRLRNWYPRLWWDGLQVHDSFEVKINELPGYVLAVSGRLNPKTGLYENQGVRTFGLYYGKGLRSEQREVEGVLVTALFTDKGAACARLCLDTAVDAIRYYRNWLGFYPFPFLTIVPGVADPIGGYPLDSGLVVIHGQEKFNLNKPDNWKIITAHEIGHQYWGEYVMDNDNPQWLWIGLGIYADRSFCRTANILPLREQGMMKAYMNGVRKSLDTTVDRPAEQVAKIPFNYNNIVIHSKGFAIISALESFLGQDVFESIYKSCLKDYGGRRLGWREFERVCEENSGQNLKWFFEEWIRSNRILSVRIKSQECIAQGNGFVSSVVIENLGSLRMPVPVEAIFEDGTEQRQSADRLFRESTLTFLSSSRLKGILLDPEKKLANVEDLPAPTAEQVAGRIEDAEWIGVGELALSLYSEAKKTDLKEKQSWFKLGLILFDSAYYAEAFDAFKTMGTKSPDPQNLFASEVWMGIIEDVRGNRQEALQHYQEALKPNTEGSLQHDQYGLMIDRAWVGDRLKTPFAWGKKKEKGKS